MQYLPRNFIERTATLSEALGDSYETVPPDQNSIQNAEQWIKRWKYIAAKNDNAAFKARMEDSGWSEEQCIQRLQGYKHRTTVKTPVWISLANEICGLLLDYKIPINTTSGDDENYQIPFQQIFSNYLESRRRLLQENLTKRGLTPVESETIVLFGINPLKDYVIEQLGPIFYALFKKFQVKGNHLSKTSNNYINFLIWMQNGALSELFESKPILLRMLATFEENWVESISEFATRLQNDIKIVAEKLLLKNDITKIEHIKKLTFNLSDYHNCGRAVIQIDFNDGLKILYKPKTLMAETVLEEMLFHLKRIDASIALEIPKVINKGAYGWMEFIEARDCRSQSEVEKYYQRVGLWLGLMNVLSGSDIHDENIIAAGAYPIPIDFEVMFEGAERSDGNFENAIQKAKEKLKGSVLAVGLLPTLGRDHKDEVFEYGGLVANTYTDRKLKWKNINSDRIELSIEVIESKYNTNCVKVDGVLARASDNIENIILGYRKILKILILDKHSGIFNKVLSKFSDLTFRRVLKPTFFYGALISRLQNFKNLNNGISWSIEAEFVYRFVTWSEKAARDTISIAHEEVSAILKGDIPLFSFVANSTKITTINKLPIECDEVDGYTRARTRLKNYTNNDIAFNSNLIRISLSESKLARQKFLRTKVCRKPDSEVIRIANQIVKRAIRYRNTACWFGLDGHLANGKNKLIVAGHDLYNGSGGIAVFLVAVGKILDRADYIKLAYHAIEPMRHKFRTSPKLSSISKIDIGVGVGLTSYLYTLNTIMNLLGDLSLKKDCDSIIEKISLEYIKSINDLDVISGLSGAILALLKYHEDYGSERSLLLAVRCGEQLLSNLGRWREIVSSDDVRSVTQANGIAHGAAGMALALYRLGNKTLRNEFNSAARSLIIFENSTFSSKTNNWPDLQSRNLAEASWACQWCHGSGGIGLARLSALKLTLGNEVIRNDETLLRNDFEKSVKGVLSLNWPGPIDTMCCGNLGNLELVGEAALKLNRPDLKKRYDSMLISVIDRARANHDYAWCEGVGILNCGLFRGIAGVGYTILRNSYPMQLPNILTFE